MIKIIEQMLDTWHRLEQVVKWTGLSVNSFALNIGLKRSENLYQIKKGNNGISRDLAELITAKYPSISKGWLLTGEGEMFIDASAGTVTSGVPYYGMDAITAVQLSPSKLPKPNYLINMTPLNDCDLAALTIGTAMQPEIPSGSIILLQEWPSTTVVPGETYLIIARYFKGIRIIRQTEDPTNYLLVPRNVEEFDPITLEKKTIEQLYLIRGVITTRT